jgi:hypothetical protein
MAASLYNTTITGKRLPFRTITVFIINYLKTLDLNSMHFRSSLKRFLFHHSFYSMEEYYEYNENTFKKKLLKFIV